jgi:hypothetical protein
MYLVEGQPQEAEDQVMVSDGGYVKGDLFRVPVASGEVGDHLKFHLGKGSSSDGLEFEFVGSFGGWEGVLGYGSGVDEISHGP